MHFQTPIRAQRHTLLRHDGLSLDQFEAKGAQEVGEQNYPLLHRERHADADTRSGPEWDIGETVDALAPFAQEAGRIEGVGIVPETAPAVQNIWRDRDHRPGGKMTAREFVVGDRLTTDNRGRRIKRPRL